MRVLLQTKATRQYLDDKDHWTVNSEVAHEFPNGLAALRYCEDHEIKNTEILYQFDDPRLNFAISVSELGSAALERGFVPRDVQK